MRCLVLPLMFMLLISFHPIKNNRIDAPIRTDPDTISLNDLVTYLQGCVEHIKKSNSKKEYFVKYTLATNQPMQVVLYAEGRLKLEPKRGVGYSLAADVIAVRNDHKYLKGFDQLPFDPAKPMKFELSLRFGYNPRPYINMEISGVVVKSVQFYYRYGLVGDPKPIIGCIIYGKEETPSKLDKDEAKYYEPTLWTLSLSRGSAEIEIPK